MRDDVWIRERVERRVLLELLAEECAELGQAALKCIRAECGEQSNPTPMTREEAQEKLLEEYGDVVLVADVLRLNLDVEGYVRKLGRWRRRLEDVEEVDAGAVAGRDTEDRSGE